MRASHDRGGVWKWWLAIVIICLAGFVLGWFLRGVLTGTVPPKALRLGGYNFISPLLACNVSGPKTLPEDQALSGMIESVIARHEKNGDANKVSTYFINLTSGQWSNTYENEQYYPSSLGKIPVMLAYYGLADSSSTVLDRQILYPLGSPDLNAVQDIKPAKAIVPGKSYSVEQLIEYMIEDSDNNATELLTSNIDENTLRNVYGDLQIPTEDQVTLANADFITPQQVSMLFRVLYNATYLSRNLSEQALRLMSRSSFTEGIVAGVSSSTVVSHKLGLVGITSGGITTEHELHDCGIVYAPSNPYLLCVMTRGASSIPAMESVISDISRTVYGGVQAGK